MTDATPRMHHIQKHILRTLCYSEWARFSDMKPDNVDSNLYQYHLKLLLKSGLITKRPTTGYQLSVEGLRYIDYVSLDTFEPRRQPKTLTKLFITNHDGQVLLWPKYKQPFIGQWSLPSGKAHFEDTSLELAARRELQYLSSQDPTDTHHAGVVEHVIYVDGTVVTHTIAHIYLTTVGQIQHKTARFYDTASLDQLDLSPGTAETIHDIQRHDSFFYAQHTIHTTLN